MRIYKTKDIIPLKVDGLTLGVSPLTFQQKMDVQTEILKGTEQSVMKGASLAVKYSLKTIKGMTLGDGSEYELEFDESGLSQECWDDLQNSEIGTKLTMVCLNLLNNVPKEFVNHETGEKIEGVSIVKQGSSRKKS